MALLPFTESMWLLIALIACPTAGVVLGKLLDIYS